MVIESMEKLLSAKEERANLRLEIAHTTNLPSVSLNLNIPGFPKTNEIVRDFFAVCLKDFKRYLIAHRIKFDSSNERLLENAAGEFYIVPVQPGGLTESELKQAGEEFENHHPLGRFIDIDITGHQGEIISSGKNKLCFYCAEIPAIECMRNGTHETDTLRNFEFSKMLEYYNQHKRTEVSRQLSTLALKAVLYEISLTPKPGLVDTLSSGSHLDMTYRTFLDSTSAIAPWFVELINEGLNYNGPLNKALPLIRFLGIRLEEAMYLNTEKVNTQKGMIFLLSLSLFTCGYLYGHEAGFGTLEFRDTIKTISAGICEMELGNNSSAGTSHGEYAFNKFGVPGIRGEAEQGFPTVFNFGLPVFQSEGELSDRALKLAFLCIAANTDDTNILYRRDRDILDKFKSMCIYTLGHFTPHNYEKLILFCKDENISPGGSADLLGLSVFIQLLIDNGFLRNSEL